ncbi:MAG TPA: hypothetical protein VGC58_00980 [Candidatus Paceibacterota bacterium]
MDAHTSKYRRSDNLLRDISVVALSIVVSLIMIKSGLISGFLVRSSEFQFLGSFVAGLFFTSVFTTAPAIVTLAKIAGANSVLITAFFGALGAVLGDLIIFRFVRDRLSDHFIEMMKHEKWWKRVSFVFKLRYFRWLTFLLGGVIIASPLPDELGIGLLGVSKMETRQFIPISFVFNFVGILIIGFLAKAI